MWSSKGFYWVAASGVAAVALASPLLLGKFPNIWRGVAGPGSELSSAAPSPIPATMALPSPTAASPSTEESPTSAAAPLQAGISNPAPKLADASPPPGPKVEQTMTSPATTPLEVPLERPTFDVVRIDPSGETVVAGHAAAWASVQLRDGGRVIAEVGADDSGQFVILPPALSAGAHNLDLSARRGGAPPIVSEVMNVDVAAPKSPAKPQAAAPMAAVAMPIAPRMAAVTPSAEIPAVRFSPVPAPAPTADSASRVSVRSVEATETGRLEVKGFAEANAIVRLYLNGSFLADALAGADRQWSLTIEHGMTPGHYAIRVDQINRANGSVVARAEVPFTYPEHPAASTGSLASAIPAAHTPPTRPATQEPVASSAPASKVASLEAVKAAPTSEALEPPKGSTQPVLAPSATNAALSPPRPTKPASAAEQSTVPSAAAPVAAPAPIAAAKAAAPTQSANASANVVVSDIRTATVVRGDSLWRLSRRFYKDGMRYRQIYAANASQIRDPSLIYPAQIFVVPRDAPVAR